MATSVQRQPSAPIQLDRHAHSAQVLCGLTPEIARRYTHVVSRQTSGLPTSQRLTAFLGANLLASATANRNYFHYENGFVACAPTILSKRRLR